jgi:hypothetical protein
MFLDDKQTFDYQTLKDKLLKRQEPEGSTKSKWHKAWKEAAEALTDA